MLVAHEQGDGDNGQSGGQRTDDGNELQHSADGTENQGVLDSHCAQKSGVRDERQCRQGELGADEVSQHLVEIVEHVFQKLTLRTRLNGRQQEVAERSSIFQEEDRQQRHDDEEPGLLGNVGQAQADPLGERCDFTAVADQKRLNDVRCWSCSSRVPLPSRSGDFAGTQLGE